MSKNKLQFSFEIFKNTISINANDWNSIPTENVFLSLNYLQAIESTVDEVTEFLYVIYYSNTKKPIGKSIFQVLTYNASTFNFDSIPCKHSTHVLKKLLNKKITLLVTGNIFATGENGFCFKGIDDDAIFNQINTCIDSVMKSNKNINYAVFKEFEPNYKKTEILIKKYRYLKFNIDDNMVLELNKKWTSFYDILQDFKTKYRQRSKKVLKNSSELTVKEFQLFDIKNNATRLEQLFKQVLKKSNFNIGIFTIDTFIQLKENLGSNYSFFGYYINEELIGFRSSFIKNNCLDTSFIGIDYNKNLKYDLYQRMLIDYINFGIATNLEQIGFGRTAEPMKSCVGAVPIPMNLYVKSRRMTGKLLLQLIVNNIKPTEFVQRKPFKLRN